MQAVIDATCLITRHILCFTNT